MRGTFAPVLNAPVGATALSYNPKLVPTGSAAVLRFAPAGEKTDVTLLVSGLVARHDYGAHLHMKPCAVDPNAAGGHFQHQLDPAAVNSASTDPDYANPKNEVWLDFRTDDAGSASANAVAAWALTATSRPASLVIHSEKTNTEPGKAGTAGARLACMTIVY